TTQATTTTTTPTTTEATTTTEAPTTIPQIELISGLLQTLLTSDEIGGGWVNTGHAIAIAASPENPFLCPEGQAIADQVGSTFAPQVSTGFRLGDDGPNVSESLSAGERTQIEQDFATWVSALEACFGNVPWEIPELGTVQLERLDLPSLGTQSIAYSVAASRQWSTVNVLISADDSGMAGVVTVQINTGGLPAEQPDPEEEWARIAGAAVAKVEPGLAGTPTFVIEAADPEELLSLGFLIQGLLTTEEIGGGWVDQGRIVVPPSATGQELGGGVFCPEGQAIAEGIGPALDRQVFTSYRREGSARVTESLIPGHRDQLTQNFATWVSAVEACFDREPWDTPEAGILRMDRLDLPSLGAESIAYYLGPGADVGDDPWVEWQIMTILVTDLDPSNDNAVVINVEVTIIHDPPDQPAPTLENDELVRIAEVAVGRFLFDE
ncbi:MAG TPA: hypothetical protein VGB41_04300, partial [Acidimicrobiia bacterium]